MVDKLYDSMLNRYDLDLSSLNDEQLEAYYSFCKLVLMHSAQAESLTHIYKEWVHTEQQIINEIERRHLLS